jgi:ABC-type Fe3+ transport system permease subunit
MAGAAIAGFAIVFVLAINESTIAPLVLTRTWPAEMAPEVLDAAMYGSPAAALAWKSWPVIGTIGLTAVIGWPGLRRLWDSVEQDTAVDLGGASLSGAGLLAITVAVTALIALTPICIFVGELYSARVSVGGSIARVWALYGAERRASLIVAGLSGVAGILVAWAACRINLRPERRVRGAARFALIGCALLAALLPAELMAQLLVQMFNRRGIAGRLYDDTPVVWVLGIIARYGFFAAAIGWYAARRVPVEILRQARIDGAGDARGGLAVARPWVARPIVAAGLLLACLSLSEVSTSLVLIPPRFGGSLAVALDNQMHYGRNQDVIVSTLLLLVPAVLVSVGVPLVWGMATGRARAAERGGG